MATSWREEGVRGVRVRLGCSGRVGRIPEWDRFSSLRGRPAGPDSAVYGPLPPVRTFGATGPPHPSEQCGFRPCDIERNAKVAQSACPTPDSPTPATYVVQVEQHRTRPPQRRQPPQAAPPAPPAPGGSAVYRVRVRSVPPVVLALRRFPNPRLTGIGAGLFAALTMFVLACVDRLLFDSSELVYGLLFLPVSALTALWVRPADLVTAPISVPIAFAVGVFPISGGSEGFGGQVMGLVTALAVHAGWLYGGTLIAGLIASVRKVRQMRARRRYVLAQGHGGAPASERAPRAAASAAAAAKPVRAGAGGAAGTGGAGAVARRPQRP